MKVLAIDPGTRRTGYAVFKMDDRVPKLAEWGMVFVRGKDLSEKLLHIHRGIERLIRRHRPKHVVIERPFVGKSPADAMVLGAARAVCMLAAATAKAKVFDYAPSQVKKAVCGNGLASKTGVQRMVRLQTGLRDGLDPDTYDAVALAICHINRL